MTSGSQRLSKSVCRGWTGLPKHWGGGCLGRFLVLPCLMMLYLAAKPSHVGGDMDVLPCSLHHPMAYNAQRGG
jgi:hypothetical protein